MRTHIPCKHQEESLYSQVTTRREGEDHDKADNWDRCYRIRWSHCHWCLSTGVCRRPYFALDLAWFAAIPHVFPKFRQGVRRQGVYTWSAYYVDGYAAAALWLPPDVLPDEDMLSSIFQRSVSEQIQKDVITVFDQMGRYHPSGPHWHLPLMGVDPLEQGKGFSSALMQLGLIRWDRDNKLAYLESSSPRSVPFYKRHGFEVLGTIQRKGSPPLFPMLRRPR